MCLGERAFGRRLTFGLRAYPGALEGGSSFEEALIGRAQFVPSAACAAPATVKNGDVEEGDWTIAPQDVDPGVAFVEENGTRRARLGAVRTGNATASARISTSNLLGGVRGSGKQEKAVVCLPSWSSGLAFDLHVSASSDCAAATPNVVHVDDFVVTSDPSCVLDETVVNGGFERAEVTWIPDANGPGAEPAVVRDPAEAHSGEAYLQLRATCTAGFVSATWSATVPPRPPAASGGPALKVWHRLRSAARAEIGIHQGEAHPIAPSASWTESALCLPRHWWGRPTGVYINLSASNDSPGTCSPTELDLDDLSLTLDPSCPLD